MHVKSLEVDFFGLPTGRFGLAVRRSTSVGWKMGTPVVESSTATFQRNQLTFAAWILVHRFLQQQLRLHHCQCAYHFSHERSAEVRFNKRLSVEINWNLLAEIRGYLFHFGTGVPKN